MSSKFSLILLACSLFLFACGGKKKKNMSGEDEVTVQDFIEFYPELSLPFRYADTSFPKKEDDSLLISQSVFYRFTPDSALSGDFAGSEAAKFYPIGRFQNGTEETYLLTRGVLKDNKIMLITAYDKEQKFIAGIPIIKVGKNSASGVSVGIDPKFNIGKNVVKTLPGGITVEGHDVYVLNNAAGKFMLVMTDSLGEASGPLINPIDTLPRTNKYAGDYGDGKRNLISFRDDKREGRMQMFVNLENDRKGCEGEIKGEVNFTSATQAEYRQDGDPCILLFTFSDKNVKVQEVEGCGSRLGTLECSFNGTYPKRKSPSKSDDNGK